MSQDQQPPSGTSRPPDLKDLSLNQYIRLRMRETSYLAALELKLQKSLRPLDPFPSEEVDDGGQGS
jgi:hypothetical protein